MAGDDVEIIVCQLAPLLFHFSFDLLPISFHAIPIHLALLPIEDARKRKAPGHSSRKCGDQGQVSRRCQRSRNLSRPKLPSPSEWGLRRPVLSLSADEDPTRSVTAASAG